MIAGAQPSLTGPSSALSSKAPSATELAAFISYAKPDREKAQEIADSLEQRGFKCWIAPRDVRPGRSYGDEIIRSFERSRTLILVLSEASNGSGFVSREIERAVSKNKPIFTVRVEDVMPAPALELFISSTQWIGAFSGRFAAAYRAPGLILGRGRGKHAPVRSVAGLGRATRGPARRPFRPALDHWPSRPPPCSASCCSAARTRPMSSCWPGPASACRERMEPRPATGRLRPARARAPSLCRSTRCAATGAMNGTTSKARSPITGKRSGSIRRTRGP